jgi:hypothetical protein
MSASLSVSLCAGPRKTTIPANMLSPVVMAPANTPPKRTQTITERVNRMKVDRSSRTSCNHNLETRAQATTSVDRAMPRSHHSLGAVMVPEVRYHSFNVWARGTLTSPQLCAGCKRTVFPSGTRNLPSYLKYVVSQREAGAQPRASGWISRQDVCGGKISRTGARVGWRVLLLADFAIKIWCKFLQDVSGHVYSELDSESTHRIGSRLIVRVVSVGNSDCRSIPADF